VGWSFPEDPGDPGVLSVSGAAIRPGCYFFRKMSLGPERTIFPPDGDPAEILPEEPAYRCKNHSLPDEFVPLMIQKTEDRKDEKCFPEKNSRMSPGEILLFTRKLFCCFFYTGKQGVIRKFSY
jgi:hypothetical protein